MCTGKSQNRVQFKHKRKDHFIGTIEPCLQHTGKRETVLQLVSVIECINYSGTQRPSWSHLSGYLPFNAE